MYGDDIGGIIMDYYNNIKLKNGKDDEIENDKDIDLSISRSSSSHLKTIEIGDYQDKQDDILIKDESLVLSITQE